jgi:hypothetical protein
VHIVWIEATIAFVIVLVGIAFIVFRKRIARFAAFRQRSYYPDAAKQVFGIQARPIYYLVLGIVVTIVGVIVALASVRR